MGSFAAVLHDTYSRRRALLIAAALVATLAVPALVGVVPARESGLLIAAGAVIGVITVLLMPNKRLNAAVTGRSDTRGTLGQGIALALYLSPLVLLNLVFPMVTPAINSQEVGGVSLTYIVLASSITTPWLAQAACMPAYRGLAQLMGDKDMSQIVPRFVQGWIPMLVQALPLVAVFGLPLWLVSGWSAQAMGLYALLCVLHLVFVQSLVIANIGERRGHWAVAWISYAAALAVAPTWVWLPPVAATLTQLFFIRGHLRHATALVRLPHGDVAKDLLRGLLLGSVLWGDKFILFMVTDGQFQVIVVFMAMLPAVLAYNFYFVNLAPAVDNNIRGLHTAIQGEPIKDLVNTSAELSRVIDRSVLRTGALGMLLTLACSLVLEVLVPEQAGLAVGIALASWAFMMLTMLSYELDYIGERHLSQWLAAAHLVVMIAAFALVPSVSAYFIIVVGDLALVALAWWLYKRAWSQPEYTLFWRHAVTW